MRRGAIVMTWEPESCVWRLKPFPLLPPLHLPMQDDKVKKRKRDDGWDSDDSDFDDMRGFERSGLALAVKGSKSLALAPSIAASLGGKTLGAKSAGAASRGARSEGGRSLQSQGQRSAKHQKGSQHSGDRFKSKKKGTGACTGRGSSELCKLLPAEHSGVARAAPHATASHTLGSPICHVQGATPRARPR